MRCTVTYIDPSDSSVKTNQVLGKDLVYNKSFFVVQLDENGLQIKRMKFQWSQVKKVVTLKRTEIKFKLFYSVTDPKPFDLEIIAITLVLCDRDSMIGQLYEWGILTKEMRKFRLTGKRVWKRPELGK